MKTNINALTVHRGESFTLDYVLKNRNGSPYIISDNLTNAYFLLNVTSATYSQQGRYSKNYWLNLDNFPKFTLSRPMKIQDLTNIDSVSFDDLLIVDDDTYGYGFYAGINGEWQFIPASYAVFYDDKSPDEYKYIGANGQWLSYTCRFIKTFTSEDTSEWVSKNYKYSIRLVTGEKVREYLKNLAIINNVDFDITESSTLELYDKLKSEGIEIQDDLDITQPIVNIASSFPILEPSVINVISYA
jgi:hypothetical protein